MATTSTRNAGKVQKDSQGSVNPKRFKIQEAQARAQKASRAALLQGKSCKQI